MPPNLSKLAKKATSRLANLAAFYDLADKCLEALAGLQLEEVQPRKEHFRHYVLLRQKRGRHYVWLRPINNKLFLWNPQEFKTYRQLTFLLLDTLAKLRQPL